MSVARGLPPLDGWCERLPFVGHWVPATNRLTPAVNLVSRRQSYQRFPPLPSSSSLSSCPHHAPNCRCLALYFTVSVCLAPRSCQPRPCRWATAAGGRHQRLSRSPPALRPTPGATLVAPVTQVEPGIAHRLWRRIARPIEGFRLSSGDSTFHSSGGCTGCRGRIRPASRRALRSAARQPIRRHRRHPFRA
ncbi:hypothetical protein D3C81_1561190 [compost metagenome]